MILVALILLGVAGYGASRFLTERSQLHAAQAALDRHDWDQARTILDTFLADRPNSAAGHLLAARAARRLELPYDAGKHLGACEQLQGAPTQAVRVERALLQVHRGDLAAAEQFLHECVANNDSDAVEILDILSGALILAYRMPEAQQCLDDLLRRQPNHFHALVRRGWIAKNEAWYPQAIEYLDRALALRPEVDSVRLSLAELQVVAGRFAEAQAHFEQLRQRQPDNPSVLFGLARCWSGRGNKQQALPLLDRALASHPDDWKALGERGWMLVQLDRPADGERDLRRAVALAPPDLPLWTRFADCLRLLGKDAEARALQVDADRLKADFQRAEQLGARIREHDPDNPDLRHELAALLLRLAKVEDALHWFGTALGKNPRHRPTHQALLEFYTKAGQHDRAAFHQQALQQPTAAPGPEPPD